MLDDEADNMVNGPVSAERLGTFGMWLFLAALSMLFVAGMLGYLIIRIQGARSPALGQIQIPRMLWVSTGLILASSFTIHYALANLRAGRKFVYRSLIWATLVLALGFATVQVPALAALLREHDAGRTSGTALYGLIFFLILLHALHVGGGIVVLARRSVAAIGVVDSSLQCTSVRYAAMYWHFLDVVWLLMFSILWIVG